LERGVASPPNEPRPRVLEISQRARRRRSAELSDAFRATATLADQLEAIWPRLALISCWTDAAAAMFVPDLKRLFPRVTIQSKGLLATEGAVSFPFKEAEGAALAIRSHFFEFAPADEAPPNAAACRLAHELDRGGRYQVILTTGGGLYRYLLGDIVEVVGFENECPRLRFLGRANKTSDLVGEKLSETQAQDAVSAAWRKLGLAPAFGLLAPIVAPRPHYALFIDDRELAARPDLQVALAEEIQSRLQSNPHYRYATELGQLAPVALHLLMGENGASWRLFERRCLESGQKAGDVKPCLFDTWTSWREAFASHVGAATDVEAHRSQPAGLNHDK
jgi:hypothetical protein